MIDYMMKNNNNEASLEFEIFIRERESIKMVVVVDYQLANVVWVDTF